jgi:hypothetical protein
MRAMVSYIQSNWSRVGSIANLLNSERIDLTHRKQTRGDDPERTILFGRGFVLR